MHKQQDQCPGVAMLELYQQAHTSLDDIAIPTAAALLRAWGELCGSFTFRNDGWQPLNLQKTVLLTLVS